MNGKIRIMTRQRGFSLVEMMVAIVIGLFLTIGAVGVLLSNKQNYIVMDDMSRLQENSRLAIRQITRDLRMAGYSGCSNVVGSITNNLNAAPANGGVSGGLFDITRAIEGFEDTVNVTGAWAPTNNAAAGSVVDAIGTNPGNMIAGTDAITIRRLGAQNAEITAPVEPGDAIPVTLNAADPSLPIFQQNSLAAITDCSGGDVFQITNNPGTGAVTLTHAAGGSLQNNVSASFGNRYDLVGLEGSTAVVSPFVAVRYYIGMGTNGPALFRQIHDPSAPAPDPANGLVACPAAPIYCQEMVEGVENMQILYGVDNTGDNIPDTYVTANDPLLGNTPANWDNVVSVRLGLLLRSVDARNPDVDTNNYALHGTALNFSGNATPNDQRRRRLVTTTAYIRNNSQ